MSKLDILLSRLQDVQQRGDGYRAQCPAHEGKSNDSLAISEAEDGRVLIHCFGGCAPLEVLHTIGLELSDLFDKRLSHCADPVQRRLSEAGIFHRRLSTAANVLAKESVVVASAGSDMLQAINFLPLDHPLHVPENHARLDCAVDTVHAVKAELDGLRRPR